MTDHVLAGLIQRRGDLTKEYDKLKARLAQIGVEVVHLDVVIRLFDPEHQSPILHFQARDLTVLARGERSRALLDVLRTAGKPLPAAEVAARVMVLQGHDPEDRAHRRVITRKVEAALWRQQKRGLLRSIRRPGEIVLWEVTR